MDNYGQILEKLRSCISENEIERIILSSPINKGECSRIDITRLTIKGMPCFQLERIIDNKAVHENIPLEGGLEKILSLMQEGFKQCNIIGKNRISILMNKKKQFRLSSVSENIGYKAAEDKTHNRQKNHILKEGEPVNWLISLGVMNEKGVVLSHMQRKLRQINKFLELISDIEKHIPQNGIIVDMGCGKSYLTFAMYHYFNIIQKKNVTILGYDLKKDVVDNCNRLAKEFGFEGLEFFAEDVSKIDKPKGHSKVDMMISLHACDTATDYTIFSGIRWDCQVIMSVPCCQHEVFNQINNNALSLILEHGILKERFSAILTDSIRAKLLQALGYKTKVFEFIETEHTPKNIVIRAIKGKNKSKESLKEVKAIISDYSLSPTLYKLLESNNYLNN